MRILLIDDDSFLRDMYATKFKELKHDVEVAADGQAGLAKIQESDFDVVLLDMVMPVMSGLDFLKEAKQTDKSGKIKYIVLSNQGEDSDRAAAKDAGAVGYIVKAESIPSDVVKQVEEMVKNN